MRLLPIDARQVVIRSQAVAPCDTIVRGALDHHTLDQSRQAIRDTADRTIITGVIEFA